jgi:hypothetical protein
MINVVVPEISVEMNFHVEMTLAEGMIIKETGIVVLVVADKRVSINRDIGVEIGMVVAVEQETEKAVTVGIETEKAVTVDTEIERAVIVDTETGIEVVVGTRTGLGVTETKIRM